MPITEYLRRNADNKPNEIALVEVNPQLMESSYKTWREFDLIQQTHKEAYRREISWRVFNEKSNRFANLLISKGVGKGDKVAILLMNCLEWLPIYFGILKTGAIAVPLNFRFSADEILYCANLAEFDVFV
ncbi:MAG: acyl--CoA ligase, partial [Coriobacteriales bacterium]|nr:acyl--CoA ligase [Coriobacteriales bacterium]